MERIFWLNNSAPWSAAWFTPKARILPRGLRFAYRIRFYRVRYAHQMGAIKCVSIFVGGPAGAVAVVRHLWRTFFRIVDVATMSWAGEQCGNSAGDREECQKAAPVHQAIHSSAFTRVPVIRIFDACHATTRRVTRDSTFGAVTSRDQRLDIIQPEKTFK